VYLIVLHFIIVLVINDVKLTMYLSWA
jgi:hypothetical protein